MAANRRSKVRRNVKEPIQSGSGESVEQQRRRRTVFAGGDRLVQQRSDFLASEVARPTGPAPAIAHFDCL
jgi:hypothetical protein